MIQERKSPDESWNTFLSKIRNVSPIRSEEISKFIKFKKSTYLADSDIIYHYETVFSKITSASNRKKWHEKDKQLLIWCVAKSLKLRGKKQLIPEKQDWEYLSQILNVNYQLLENKWLQLIHSNLMIKRWTKEEDELLIQICNDLLKTNNWTKVALEFNSLSNTQRYPKQIRERYNNVLNPTLRKMAWAEKDNQLLIDLVKKYGKKWSKISFHFEGRSENQLRFKFNLLKKSQKIQERCSLSNGFSELIDAQEYDLQKIVSKDLLNQPQVCASNQEQIQILQHQQQPYYQYSQEQKCSQPTYHNYYNYHFYPQEIKIQQQPYFNFDPRFYGYNYPNCSNQKQNF